MHQLHMAIKNLASWKQSYDWLHVDNHTHCRFQSHISSSIYSASQLCWLLVILYISVLVQWQLTLTQTSLMQWVYKKTLSTRTENPSWHVQRDFLGSTGRSPCVALSGHHLRHPHLRQSEISLLIHAPSDILMYLAKLSCHNHIPAYSRGHYRGEVLPLLVMFEWVGQG